MLGAMLHDPRVVRFMLDLLSNEHEPVQVRVHVLKHLRDRSLTNELRQSVANAMLGLVVDGCPPQLRLQAALALGEFTDIDGVPAGLGAVAGHPDLPLDIRYSAFTALERTGPTRECVALLSQLLSDDAFGASAKSLLLSWGVGELQ